MFPDSSLRQRVSDKVAELVGVNGGSALYNKLLAAGVDQRGLDGFIISGTVKVRNRHVPYDRLCSDIVKMFELGGRLSGSGALKVAGYIDDIKDYDFYFNDEVAFMKAHLIVHDNPFIDVCWCFDSPYELHDLGVVMCCVHDDGRVELSPECRAAFETRVSDLFPERVIWPDRTVARMVKYNRRFGMRYPLEKVAVLCSVFPMSGLSVRAAMSLAV